MSKPTGDIDFFALAAFVAKHAPGVGDPMAMPIDRMLAVAHSTSELLVREFTARGGSR
jgi:hypothetical protein